MKPVKHDMKRRTFLAAAACTPALAVAALLSSRQAAAEAVLPAVADEPQTSSGYHETEHIRKYYRCAAYF